MRGTRMALEIPERFLTPSLSGFKIGTTTRGCVRSPCVVSKRTFADHYRLGGKICNETTSVYGVVFVSRSQVRRANVNPFARVVELQNAMR
jgi:hypothetical protein